MKTILINTLFLIYISFFTCNSIKNRQITFSSKLDIGNKQNTTVLNTKANPCKCGQIPTIEPSKIKIIKTNLTPELINGIRYNIPVIVEDIVFLTEDFKVSPSVNKIITCPNGYNAITENQMKIVMKSLGNNTYQKLNQLIGFDYNKMYILNTKAYNTTDIKLDESYTFKSIDINKELREIKISNVSTFYTKNIYTKCVQDSSSNYHLNIQTGLENNSLYVGKDIQIFFSNTNLKGTFWVIDEKTFQNSKPKYIPKTEGCMYIFGYAILLNNELVSTCRGDYVMESFGKSVKANLTNANISKSIFHKNATNNPLILLKPEDATFDIDGKENYAICYTDNNNMVHMMFLDKYLKQKWEIELGIGNALDVTRVRKGFVVLMREPLTTSNRCFLIMINKKGKLVWTKDIINNVMDPISRSNKDLVFYKNKTVSFGMEAMSKVNEGRLKYTRGRIGVILSRMNNFGKNIAQGDLMFSLNDKGEDPKLSFSWGASPTIKMQLITNLKDFITASLGTGFPKNIKSCIIKSQEYDENGNHLTVCKDILEEILPSDEYGNSCGRLGGLSYSNGLYFTSYSRSPCKVKQADGSIDKAISNTFGLIIYDENFVIKKNISFGKGKDIICVNSSMYGKYILISFTISGESRELYTTPKNYINYKLDKTYLITVDSNGSVITPPRKVDLPSCNSIKSNKKGGVSWIDVNPSGDILLTKIEV